MKLRINNIVRTYGNICIELVKIGGSLEVDNTEDKSYRINTKFFMSKIITHDEYVEIVKNNNKYVDIIGIYNGMRNKILCRCKICGEEYEAIAYDVKIGKKHRACASTISSSKRLKNNDDFVNEVKNIFPHVSLLEPYNGAHQKILCRCNIHDELFSTSPTKLLSCKSGCQQCRSTAISAALRKSHLDFVSQLHLINDKIDVIGQYVKSKDKIKVKCKKCGFVWEPSAGSLLAGNGCPHCVGRYKTTEELKSEILSINDTINIIGDYIDSHTKIKCRCNICGCEWFAWPSNLKYSGCPECNMSHGEKAIQKYLKDHGIQFTTQKTFDGLLGVRGGNLSYDFYINDKRILIEYQGEFHDGTAYQQTQEEYEIQKEHDMRKRDYAKKNGYTLIEIWYWEYDNINEILERRLY